MMKELYAKTWMASGGSTPGDKERKFTVGVGLRDVVGLTPFKDGPTVEYVQLVPVTWLATVDAALANCREKQHDNLAELDANIAALNKKREELLEFDTQTKGAASKGKRTTLSESLRLETPSE